MEALILSNPQSDSFLLNLNSIPQFFIKEVKNLKCIISWTKSDKEGWKLKTSTAEQLGKWGKSAILLLLF